MNGLRKRNKLKTFNFLRLQGRSYLYARTHVRTWKNAEG